MEIHVQSCFKRNQSKLALLNNAYRMLNAYILLSFNTAPATVLEKAEIGRSPCYRRSNGGKLSLTVWFSTYSNPRLRLSSTCLIGTNYKLKIGYPTSNYNKTSNRKLWENKHYELHSLRLKCVRLPCQVLQITNASCAPISIKCHKRLGACVEDQ